MKILVYAFKPFLGLKHNLSEIVLNKINPRNNLKKVVFEVNFDKKQFTEPIKEYDPEVIIGLGMWFKGSKFRIERKAVNLKWRSRKEVPKKISQSGPNHYFSSLKIKKDGSSWLSYNAGKYVCNYTMYTFLHSFKDKKFAFIHIPMKSSINKAVQFIEKAINKLG